LLLQSAALVVKYLMRLTNCSIALFYVVNVSSVLLLFVDASDELIDTRSSAVTETAWCSVSLHILLSH